jgi:hypothetical protein
MYKLVEHLTDVRTYALNDKNELAIIKENSFFYKKNNKYVKLYDFPKVMQEMYFNHHFYANSIWGDGYVFENDKIIELDRSIAGIISNNKIIGSKWDDNGKGIFTFYDLIAKDEKLISNSISMLCFFSDRATYQRSFKANTLLEKISLIDGNLIWKSDLKKLGKYFKKEYEIDKVIGIHNGELLVGCGNTVLLAVDPETGVIIHQWQELEKTDDGRFPKGKIGNFTSCVLLPNENKLIGCGVERFWEIDLVTRVAVKHDITEKLKLKGIGHMTGDKPALNATHYLLTAYSVYDLNAQIKPNTILFALNKETIEIDWVYNFEPSLVGVFRETKIISNKLYQLYNSGDLFIFEQTII